MKPSALAAGAAVSILLASCSSSPTTTGSTPAPAPAAPTAGFSNGGGMASAAGGASKAAGGITISNFAYSGTMTVKPGEKVTVTNTDSAAHTLTDKASHKFDTGSIAGGGGTGTFTAPSTPGSFPFGCTFHPNMAGTLIVAG